MSPDTSLLAIFTTGLLTGGLTCIAVQGGLLTSALLQVDRSKKQELRIKENKNLISVLAFIFAKLLAYTILGFFLGWIGSVLQISLQARIHLQFAVVVFMLGTAFNLLNLHPIFRYFIINPPSWLTRIAYKQTANKSLFAPILLGFLTVFIPCGATQAMMALAVASGSPIWGGVIMFVFVLGTSPVFFLLGLLTVRLRTLNKKFVKIAAYAIILLALFNLDATLALSNSPVTIRSAIKRAYCIFSYCNYGLSLSPVTEQTIIFTPTGYSPDRFAVRRGERVTLHLHNEKASGCIQSFTISALNIQKIVLPDKTETIEFTAPDKPGRITFTCSAGLYP
ncbi:MAG TPA: sulfite exporter TauE/SafE family protein, partial [Xanthomonadales bacterium]|nr:sulfite exporter TauE/SafE family protein [Xanthomonadales bacterium]